MFLSSKKYDSGCSMFIPDPDPDFLPISDPRSQIPDLGVKKWVGGKTTNLVVLLNSLVLPERIIFHAEAVPEGVHHGAGGLALPQ